MHTRSCPDCGEEFRPEIVRCSDCGAELQDRYDDDAQERKAAEPAEPECAESYAPVFTTIETEALREAAACLAAAAIAFRATGNSTGYQLLVRPGDRSLAVQALAGREGALVLAPESPLAPGHEGGPCPACGAQLDAGLLECPECQLALGEAPAACRSCGAALTEGQLHCPVCGMTVEE
jgi:hypothetical protein